MTTAQVGIRSGNVIVPYVSATKRTKEITLTVTGINSWTTTRAVGIIYADSAGNWRLKYNIAGTTATGAKSSTYINISNVVFKNVANNWQAGSVIAANAASIDTPYDSWCYHYPNSSRIDIVHASADISSYNLQGDVELDAEPTTYTTAANMEGVLAADVYVNNYVPGVSSGLVPAAGLPPGETYTNTAASGAGAVTIDFSTAALQRLVLTGNCALTLTAATLPQTCILMLVQDGTGTRIPTWSTTIKWAGGTAPTLSTAINSVDILTFARINSVWYGMFNLDFK